MGESITRKDGHKATELDEFNLSNHKYKIEAISIENPMGKHYVRFRLEIFIKETRYEITVASYLANKYLFLMKALHLEESEKVFFMAHNILELVSKDDISHRELYELR
ncbi:hypothetical protein [Staphylococcus caeli]|uniref:hypothetical protein n=1 Tax=Staphylococcus caeli TaxID=2201815 RepID=UPI003F55BBED